MRKIIRSSTAVLLLLNSYTLILPTVLAAQELEDDMKSAIEKLQNAQGSTNFQKAISRRDAQRTVKDIINAEEVASEPISDPADTLLSHVIAEKGLLLPSPELVILRPNSLILEKEKFDTPSTESERPPVTQPALKKCTSDSSVRLPRDSRTSQSETIVDELFIPERYTPDDPNEVYGAKTSVHSYSDKPSKEFRVASASNGVPCVPYRLRITSRYEYRETGKSVFRNYDKDADGKGIIHQWVQEKLLSYR